MGYTGGGKGRMLGGVLAVMAVTGSALAEQGQGSTAVSAQGDGLQLAQAAERGFDIPAMPLADALARFGLQSGLQVSVDANLVRDRNSPGVRGTMPPEQALQRLLTGTGITFQLTADGDVLLESEPDSAILQLPSVLIKAKRGPENVQRVAGSDYVFDSRELERSQTRGIEGVLRQTPNAFFEERSNGDVVINLRGNSTRNNNTDAGIGLYVDGAYNYIQGNNNNIPLFDIDQVNVLLGPQGGLYGRNAVGGAINIQTANPTDIFEARVKAGAGNYDARNLEAMLNLPTESRNLRFRIAGFHDERDGYLSNSTVGRDEKDMARDGGRFKVGITPHEDWDMVFGAERIEQRLPGTALVTADDPDHSINDILGRTSRNSTRYSSDIKWLASDWLTVRSISGLSLPDGELLSDGDGTAAPVASIFNTFDARQINQEFRFSSPDEVGGPLSWVVGLNYFRDDIDTRQDTTRLADRRLDRALIDGRIEQYAVFGEATYEILAGLRLTGSLRYSQEDKDVSVELLRKTAAAPRFTTLFVNDSDDTYKRWNPGLSLAYDWNEHLMTYAKVATAYKSGGVNFGPTPFPGEATFDPEDVISYEVGAKSQWFDDRLVLNASLFHQKQEDFQLRTRIGATSFFSNVGDGVTDGAELSLRALPLEGLELSAAYGYLLAEFDDAPQVQVALPPNGAGTTMDVSGKRIPDVPTHTLNLASTYRMALTDQLDAILRAEYYVTRGGYADAGNFVDLDERNSVNLSAGVESERFAVTLFANNVFDEEYFEVTPTFGSPAVGQRNAPRTVGVSTELYW
ncbi:TonB-dependent receptor domain-containing protein [Pseudomonas schmalbachii]|uniref:TonB-dependent receptor n=1 Tax=Pseudomonas schmalbachii TaxID=2816993 RepID=A0ABS3TKX0_9PSED|nr:TonB-dependent receptor [Pseudomonas schmalbachii]MBO3274299.1 TonB-dependent receptor [Pseudomonas schmalbachii]